MIFLWPLGVSVYLNSVFLCLLFLCLLFSGLLFPAGLPRFPEYGQKFPDGAWFVCFHGESDVFCLEWVFS